MLPRSKAAEIVRETKTARYAILSRGPWPAENKPEAAEILFEDGSDSPFCLHLTPESFDLLPAEPPAGRSWRLALWTQTPRLEKEMECRYRRVPRVPWLKPWPTD